MECCCKFVDPYDCDSGDDRFTDNALQTPLLQSIHHQNSYLGGFLHIFLITGYSWLVNSFFPNVAVHLFLSLSRVSIFVASGLQTPISTVLGKF